MFEALLGWFALTSRWELAAVALALAYVLLAVKKHMACWLAAILSSGIYVVLMIESRLYMEAVLNAFYVAMAVYGYWAWLRGRDSSGEVKVERLRSQGHALAIVLIGVLTITNGILLAKYTDAARPFLDSLITWSSVVATWMVARRIAENWLYWIAIDAVAALLYFQQNRVPTALLFVFYVVVSIQGYRVWLRESVTPIADTSADAKA